MANYLICYDIANPKRLAKVHRKVVKQAAFVQFSVYYFSGSKADLDNFLIDIEQIIHVKEDDVRVYLVESLKKATQVGQSWLPDGILFV